MLMNILNRRRFVQLGAACFGSLALGAAASQWFATPAFASGSSATDWFWSAKLGAWNHYLSDSSIHSSSDWNNTVNSVDVNALANQLASTGVKYYIFTLGQNSGYYCSPNATYDSIVNVHPSRCSTRDLIADLYTALAPKGIKLMTYLPAGAPNADSTAYTALQWSDGPQRNAQFQLYWNSIIREWATRWGENVGGWWFDGCFWPDATYNFSASPDWNDFASAARAGNSHAIVAFNPGVQNPIQAECPQEDYTAGETNDPSQVHCPGRWVNANANNSGGGNASIQWHMLSFLGNSWQDSTPRFTTEQVVQYTSKQITNGGVVTWDSHISLNGAIDQTYIDQLATAQHALTPHIVGDLARGKLAYLQDNNGNSVPVNSGVYFAANALDNNIHTQAQGSAQWAWTLHIDLASVQANIQNVTVKFTPNYYATQFQILLSTDGNSWNTIASVSNWDGSIYFANFSATSARYVRVRALAPNAPNQTGIQMALTEVLVLNTANNDLALGAAAYLQDNNGNPLSVNSGTAFASYAVDGDTSLTNVAQAGDQWAWTLHVDLGTVQKNVNKVTVLFGSGYATQFTILLSTDGSSWNTVASVSNFTGGTSTSTFSATNARYVRVRAITPDGPNQIGGQMSIAALQVFNS